VGWLMAERSEAPAKHAAGASLRSATSHPVFPGITQLHLGRIHYFGQRGRVRDGKRERIEGDSWKEALAVFGRERGSGRAPMPG